MQGASLKILRCRECGRSQLPPREHCRFCGEEALEPAELSPEGEVYSFTVIRVPPARFAEDAPYTVIALRLNDDITLTGRIIGEDSTATETGQPPVQVGDRLRVARLDKEGCWFTRAGQP